jgi:hypothetical protein
LLFSSIFLKHGHHFAYWNQHLNMHMCICYLDCHEVGLCCHLVIHIENLLHPLQLFYFHLWPIYWQPDKTNIYSETSILRCQILSFLRTHALYAWSRPYAHNK